ncbi:MAG: hypothetical protein ACW976_07735, partial [Candidatus Ranarchaeia archaeon]
MPKHLWGRPGSKINLGLVWKSSFSKVVKGMVHISSPQDISLSQNRVDFRVTPESHAGVDIEVTLPNDSPTTVIPIHVQGEIDFEGKLIKTRLETIYLHCLAFGGVSISESDSGRRLLVQNEYMSFEINLMKGAHVDRLYSKQTGAMRVRSFVRDRIGPPFWPSEQMRSRFTHQITEQQNSISIKTWMQSKKYPGLQFAKTYVITGRSPILKIKRSLSNTKSSNTYNLGLQSTGWGQNMIHHP